MSDASQSLPVLEVRDATKRFGAVTALDGVTLHVSPGEVLALLGDNGAGKSTLIKAISGVQRLDSGTITLDGIDITRANAIDVRSHGIETVYQDLALFDNLGPAANFFAGRELARPRWLPPALRLLQGRQMSERTRDLIDRLQISIPNFDAPVALMSGGQRQAVAVARAVAFSSRLVILDEPTAALGLRESGRVLSLIHRLKDDGIAVLLISHSMDHVLAVADRALVLRRGRRVGELTPTADTLEQLVAWIVGATDNHRSDDSIVQSPHRRNP
jgi:ABC-type sugar transport system ATPase subunit